jgi:hypothetical protein
MIDLTSTRSAVRDLLDAECHVFTRHIMGCAPDPYVCAKYQAAHTVMPALLTADRFDESLVAFARSGPLCTKVADSYARVFSRGSALRKKLVLLLAILETRPPFHGKIDQAIGGPAVLVLARLALRTAGAAMSLVAGIMILFPTRVVLALTQKVRR